MPYTSDNFVANSITKSLQDKILANTWKKIATTTLYVSNQGDDTTADGSQEKPFATISKAVSHIFDNYRQRPNSAININCLTDIDEGTTQISFYWHGNRIFLNANDHEVKVGSVAVTHSELQFNGVTFLGRANTRALDVAQGAIVVLNNCTIESHLNPYVSLHVHRGASIVVQGNTTFNTSNGFGLFYVERFGNIYTGGTITVNDTSESNTNGFVLGRTQGLCYFNTSAQLTGTFKGKKYDLYSGSQLDTFGRGTGFLLGTDGEAEEFCIVS